MQNNLLKTKKTSLSDRAYEYLKEQIVQGELNDGDIITEQKVGDFLGMSRTPVKRALTKLELESYVKCIDGVGTVVVGLSLSDLNDIYNVRMSLETLALKTSIKNINLVQIEKMRTEFNEKLEEYKKMKYLSPLEIAELDAKFHALIINNCNNNYIVKLMNLITTQANRYKLQAYTYTDTFEESVRQHLEILKHIEDDNYEEAAECLEKHIKWSYRALAELYI